MNELTIQAESGSILLTEKGVTITGKLTQYEWSDGLRKLKQVKDRYHQAVAGMVDYGKQEFGLNVVKETLEQIQFDIGDANRALAISGLESGVKELGISSEAQYVLGRYLPDKPAEQARWAEIAKREKLSAQDLKTSIEVGKIVRSKDRENGFASFESVLILFERTKRHFDPSAMTPAQRREIAKLLSPIQQYVEGLVS